MVELQFVGVAALFLCVANVHAGSFEGTFVQTGTTMRVTTHVNGSACGATYNPDAAVVCDGGLERKLQDGAVATNVIPQVQNVVLKYEGAMPAFAYVSLIDAQFACTSYPHGPTADNINSGIQQANDQKVVTIPQAQPNGDEELLTSTQNGQEQMFRLCYSCNNLTSTNCTNIDYDWRDSGIQLHISRLESIVAYNVVHKTEGTIPYHNNLHIRYTGPLANERWVSFVDDTLNSNFPCGSGVHAAAAADSSHSGSLSASAGTKEFNMKSDELSPSKRFAVCYAESGGIKSSQWRDTGIRVRRSAITAAKYGVHPKFGDGFERISWNRYSNRGSNADVDITTDRFPRVPSAMLQVVSDLLSSNNGAQIALVDADLMNANPCMYSQLATAIPNTYNFMSANNPDLQSPPQPYGPNRRHFTGAVTADSNGFATFLQGEGDLLDPQSAVCASSSCSWSGMKEHTYALCYSLGTDTTTLTTDDAGWADTYIRYKITDIETIKHHGVLHATNGHLPRSTLDGTAGPGELKIEFGASNDESAYPWTGFAPGNAVRPRNALFFTSDSSYNPTNEQSSDPCASLDPELTPQAASSGYESGFIKPENLVNNSFFPLATTSLHTGEVDPATRALTKTYFAVCYSRDFQDFDGARGTAHWFDSGIRVTVGKISRIEYGNVHGSSHYAQSPLYQKRKMYPHWQSETSDGSSFRTGYASWDGAIYSMNYNNGQSRAHNIISQDPNQVIEYVSTTPSGQELGNNAWISLVDATLNGGDDHMGQRWSKPCAYVEAPTSADTLHSGVMQAGSSDTLVTLLQNLALSETKLFAVCYAVQTGTSADQSWDDSYIRVRVSMVSQISSVNVVHEVYNDDKYVSTIAHRGQDLLDLTYEGTLPAGSQLSLVNEVIHSSDSRAGNTGVCQDFATNTAGGEASGPLTTKNIVTGSSDSNSKTVQLQTSTLFHNITFAICYQPSGGSWYDTGIRVRRTEFSSARFYNLYEAPAAREQTSIFKDTNRLPRVADQSLKYIADAAPEFDLYNYNPTPNGRYVSLVTVQDTLALNSMNPCTVGAFAAMSSHTGAAGPAGARLMSTASKATQDDSAHCRDLSSSPHRECGDFTVNQASQDEYLDSSATFAICYCNECTGTSDGDKLWYDSYIRLGISQIASISQNFGMWGSEAGVTVTHIASGQIPNMSPSPENSGLSNEGTSNQGLTLTYIGSGLSGSTSLSLVEQEINPVLEYGVTYYQPCRDTSLWTDSGLYTNPVVGSGSSSTGNVTTLDTTSLYTDRVYALCYSLDSASFSDSGIRLTIPKLINIQHDSIHAGISPRSQTAVFRPTNRLPQADGSSTPAVQLKYLGPQCTDPSHSACELPGQKFVQLIKVEDTGDAVRNPCVNFDLLGGGASSTNTGPLTANANRVIELPEVILEHMAVFAVCYSDGASENSGRIPVHDYESDGVTPVMTFQNNNWRDSYIRVQVTMVAAIKAGGLITTTDGQIPNTHAGMYFQYLGELDANRWISLVYDKSRTVDGYYEPCSTESSNINDQPGTHTGRKQALSSEYWIDSLDTTLLWTNITFALCYSDVAAGTSGWVDSGIRLSLPKIYSVEALSQYSGGSDTCHFHGGDPTYSSVAYSGDCKRDTMARQQTSKPLSTNRLAQDGKHEQLRYVGDLPASGQVAIVDASVNSNAGWDGSSLGYHNTLEGSSPCVNYVGAASNGGFYVQSDILLADSAKQFEVGSNVEFAAGITVAVCYYDPAATTPGKWRESFIRLKVSRVGALQVQMPTLLIGTSSGETTLSNITLKTVGQIPRQKPNSQVIYQYHSSPSATGNYKLALVEDMQDVSTRSGGAGITRNPTEGFKRNLNETLGFNIHQPCENYDYENHPRTSTQQAFEPAVNYKTQGFDSWSAHIDSNSDGSNDGADASSAALLSHDGIYIRDPDGAETPTVISYALCYNTTSGWFDSGIRVTVSQLDTMHYRDALAQRMYDAKSISGPLSTTDGQYKVMVGHTTFVSSAYQSTNQLPQRATTGGTVLTVGRWVNPSGSDAYIHSDLSGSRYVSIVDASRNNYNPCVDPAEASHVPDSHHSGPMLASQQAGDNFYVRSVTLQSATPLSSTATFAACYSHSGSAVPTAGGDNDVAWRDSYVRFTISKVESVVSYQVTHQTVGGQIANHQSLKLNYVGSLEANSIISLVATGHTGSWIDSLQSNFPCAVQSIAGGAADSYRSGSSTTGNVTATSDSYLVTLDTTALNATLEFAVCYSNPMTSGFHDSGIRVSLPKIYKFTYQSRHWSEALSEGTPNRDFVSFEQEDGYELIDTPTNRLPQSSTLGSILSFVDGVHSTASNVIDGSERISIVQVSASINNGDPCTNPDIASPSPGAETNRNTLYFAGQTTPAGVNVHGDEEIRVNTSTAVLTMDVTLIGDDSPDEVYALCYTDGPGGVDDELWRDTYVRVKLSLVNSLVVAGVRHFTDGHIPVTAAADGMKWHYDVDGTLGNEKAISLVDATLSSGRPCADPGVAALGSDPGADSNWYYINGTDNLDQPHLKHWTHKATHSGPQRAMDGVGYVQGVDTRFLRKAAQFALCYGHSRSSQQWYDSGIRVSVSRVSAIKYAACNNCGPTEHMCTYVNTADADVQHTCDTNNDGVFEELCTTRARCDPESPYNGGCGSTPATCGTKLDTAPRIMTTATKASNRLPSIANVELTVMGDLPVNSHFSLVRFDAYISDAMERFSATDPDGRYVEGSYNPCVFDSIASAASTASIPPAGERIGELTGSDSDRRSFTGTMTASGMTITIPQISDSSGVHDRLDARLGNMYALCYNTDSLVAPSKWRDSYLRVKMSRIHSINVLNPSLTVGTGDVSEVISTTKILTQGQLNNQANYSNVQQATFKVEGQLTQVYGTTTGAQLPAKIALIWLKPENDMGSQAKYYDTQLHEHTNTRGDWGMDYLDPCQHYGDLNLITTPSGDSGERSDQLELTTTAVSGTQVDSTLGILDLSSLNSEKTYAVCYADINTADWRDEKWADSGIRVTLPRVTQLDYQGTPDDVGRAERTRTMGTWLQPTNVLPQVPNVQFTYFHSTDATRGLNSGQWIAVVDAGQGVASSSPCTDYSVVEAAGLTSTGATQSPQVTCVTDNDCINVHNTSRCDGATNVCTGGAIDLPQNVLLDADKLYAVCYAESTAGDQSIIDFTTWKDTYIRLTISQIEKVSSFSVTHETTGQVANHRLLPVSYNWTEASTVGQLDYMYLVKDEISSPNSLVASLDTYFPCNVLDYVGSMVETDYVRAQTTGTVTSTVQVATELNTQNLNTWNSNGGIMSNPKRCWQNSKHCLGSTNWGHQAYAVCYARSNGGTTFHDSGIRVTVSQVATLKLDSGWTTTPNRFMTSAELAINTFPVDRNVDTKVYWKRDQGTSNAITDPLPKGATHFSLVSTALNLDPCANPALASAAGGSCTAGTCIRNSATSNNLATTDWIEFAKSATVNLQQVDHSFAVCYTGSNGGAADYGWRDSYIRLKISKIFTFSAVSVTHTTFGQIPSVQMNENMKFSWTGSLDNSGAHISLVDAGLNDNQPCASSEAAQNADGRHSGPAAASGSAVGTGFTTSLVTASLYLPTDLTLSPVKDSMDPNEPADQYYDQDNAYQQDYYFALCFSSDYADALNPGSWFDSGIRVTTPSLTQLELPSQYSGIATRVYTSYEVATNKIPSGELEFSLIYSAPNSVNQDAALDSGYISLVATEGTAVQNQYNPCVYPTDASLAYSSQSSGAGASQIISNGVAGHRRRQGRAFTQTNFSRYQGQSGIDNIFTYAVCYSGNSHYANNNGDNTDVGWRDSYIRLTISDVEWFGTKGLRHRTTGQLPYHKQGLIYEVSQQSWDVNFIALIDETLNQVAGNSHFSDAFATPCKKEGVWVPGDGNVVNGSSSGIHPVDNFNTANTLSTVVLNTSKTFALCYYTGGDSNAADGSTRDTAWADSGIRVTISSMWGIEYSGYSRQITESIGQRWRTITSTVPELQPAGQGMTHELVSHVLPKKSGAMHLVYTGDLPESQRISVVQWTNPCTTTSDDLTDSSNNKNECSSYVQADSSNPCVDATTATSMWSGQACKSYEQGWVGHSMMSRCDYYNGATSAGNKEFTFDLSDSLQSSNTYTFCYSEDDGTTWRDSFIRFSVSDVETIMTPQLTTSASFFDHGHLGRYENAVKLQLEYAGNNTSAGGWVALVDETITASQHPCTGGAFWHPLAGDKATTTLTVQSPLGTTENHYIIGNSIWGQQTFSFTTVDGTAPATSVTITGQTSGAKFLWQGLGGSPSTQMIVSVRSSGSVIPGEMITNDDKSWNATLTSFSSIAEGKIMGVTTKSGTIAYSEASLVIAQNSGAYEFGHYVTSQVRAGYSSTGWSSSTEWFDVLVQFSEDRFNNSLVAQDYTTSTMNVVSGYTKLGTDGFCVSPASSTTEATPLHSAGPGWESSRGIEGCQEMCNYFHICVGFAWEQDNTCVMYSACDAIYTGNYLGDNVNHVFTKDAVSSPTVNTYVGARAMNGQQVVEIETEHMDVTKQYVACYKSMASSTWSDTGMRFSLSKLHSIRYNAAEMPANQFRVDISTSRAKVGLARCVSVTAAPEATCGQFLNETCQIGSLCDPDLPPVDTNQDGVPNVNENRNGGCGTYKPDYASGDSMLALGQCTSALAPISYVCMGAVLTPSPTPNVNNPHDLCDVDFDGVFGETCVAPATVTCTSDTDCQGYEPTSRCRFSGASGKCMIGDQVFVKYARCNPDNVDNGGCGALGTTCNILHSPTVYNHAWMNILPQPGDGTTTALQALSTDLQDGLNTGAESSIVLVDSTGNNGEPCLHAASSASLSLLVNNDDSVNLPGDSFASGTEYTVCYNGTGVGVGVQSTHGPQWFDSYIRLKFSEISAVSHHDATHTKQGHISATNSFGLTYTGKLVAGMYISLVDETQNGARPCSANAVSSSTFSVTTGAQLTTGTGTRQVSFDTRILDTRKNFAICYGTATTSMADSGIRVTVATMSSLRYNYAQYSDYVPEGRYERYMYSTNMAPTDCESFDCASDSIPAATNRLPVPGGRRFLEYYAADGLSTKQIMIVVDSSRNNNNPCMDFSDMALNTSSFSSGSVITAPSRRFEIPDSTRLDVEVEKYTTCYCNLYNHIGVDSVDYTTCRDSYIHMEPTLVQTITAYGQDHVTTGQVASRSALGLLVDGGVLSTSTSFPDAATSHLVMIDETENGYHPCASLPLGILSGTTYSGISTAHESPRTFTLSTETLSPDLRFSLCYSIDSGSTFKDSGLRLTVPKLIDITYSAPVRKLEASTCFSAANPLDSSGSSSSGGIANCYPDPTRTSKRNSQLPQSHEVQFTYNGHSSSTISDGYLVRLVDHELGYNNPCATGATAAGSVDRRQSTNALETRPGRSVVVNSTEDNLLDYNKTFALCYSDGSNLTLGFNLTLAEMDLILHHQSWRDSFVRVTWSHIHTLKIAGDSFSVTTKGLVPAVPQLRVEWAFSTLSMPETDNNNHYSPWVRFTSENQNSGFPCHQDNADQTVGVNSTAKHQVLATANEFVIIDTSILGDSTGSSSFAICTAIGDGSSTDISWEDSGIRVRVVRWANSAKSRVVAGAPSILYYDLNTGDFLNSNGKVALVGYDNAGQATQGCETAKDALQNSKPYFSTGNAVMRRVDYRCKKIGTSPDNNCDAGGPFAAMDETFTDRCIVGARCNPGGGNAAGCGSDGGGECSASVQLPTGKSYTGLREAHVVGVWQDEPVIEQELQTGSYSMCVCDDLQGDGGCDDINEWTVMFNSNVSVPDPINPGSTYGGNLHVISRPRLGRDDSPFGTLRHLQNQSHRYNIRANNSKTGYEVQDNDRIYFAPAEFGCGQVTSWSGAPENWRSSSTTICKSVGGVGIAASCDVDLDGRFEEACVVGARCREWSPDDPTGGCGGAGVCEIPRVAADTSEQTAPILIANLTGQTAVFTTPTVTFLEKEQHLVACYATRQSFYSNDPNVQTEHGDYAELDDTLQVIASPQVGPGDNSRWHVNDKMYLATTTIRALENSSPKFHVSSLSDGDLIYFMPRTPPPLDDEADCTPFMCTSVSGSMVGSNCDADFDNVFADTCVQYAACDLSNSNNGGCGSSGTCERAIPQINHASFTKPAEGTEFTGPNGWVQLPTDVHLTTDGAALDTSCTPGLGGSLGTTYGATPSCQPGSAKYLVTCFIPRGAIVELSNVHRLSEDLTIFMEPTAALETTHFQGRVYMLDFTSPQQGDYNRPQDKEFSTGLPGDCIVLTQAATCANAYEVTQESYFVGLHLNTVTGQYEEQYRSAKMVLDERDKDTTTHGDVKGGVASYRALAHGKVNELPEGMYKICYATMNSECDQPEDFTMLSKQIEILPADQSGATLKVHVTVQLGHDILVEWSSNRGLSPRDMIGETWVGLYDKGACVDTHPQTLRHMCQPEGGRQQPLAHRSLETVRVLGGFCTHDEDCHPEEWRHKCARHHDPTDSACSDSSHLAMCYKSKCTGGIDSGTLRFSMSEYQQAGDYEVRLFQGDARNKNGIFCGGMTGTPHETYTQCTYESAVNATIKVYNNREMLEDLEILPGFEVVFNGNRGTYANPWARVRP